MSDNLISHSPFSAAEGLREFTRKIVNVDAFIVEIQAWIQENLNPSSGNSKFRSPFQLDQLRLLDYALEGVAFQQLLRMPVSQSSATPPGEILKIETTAGKMQLWDQDSVTELLLVRHLHFNFRKPSFCSNFILPQKNIQYCLQ